MSDETAASAANDTATPVIEAPTPDPKLGVSTDDAAAFLKARRTGVAPEPKPTPESTSQEADVAAPQEHPDDTVTEDVDPAGEPSIEPPRSLTKAEKEVFASLPPDLQEVWANRERDRETYYRKGHDEAAAKAKAAEAREQAAEQKRLHYDQALPKLLQNFQYAFANKFQDIQTVDDLRAMKDADPLRYQDWQFEKEQGQILQQEAEQAEQRQRQENAKQWKNYKQTQEAKFLEKAPEFRDVKKAASLQSESAQMMADAGFSNDELAGAWEHGERLSLRDHRLQLLLRDAMRYRAAEKARKAATPKAVPPVVRPGVASSRGESSTNHIRDLTNKVKSTGSVDAAVALLRARRNAAAR